MKTPLSTQTTISPLDQINFGEEFDTVLYEWNKTDAPWPTEKCIHHLFEAQAEGYPCTNRSDRWRASYQL